MNQRNFTNNILNPGAGYRGGRAQGGNPAIRGGDAGAGGSGTHIRRGRRGMGVP